MSPAADLQRADFARILLIKPTALGDVVHTVPVLVKLRRRFPQAQIDWLITPENASLVQAHPALSHTVLFDRAAFRRSWWGSVRGFLGLLAQLRRTRYELVLDLHGQARSALFTLATGAPVRIGFDRPIRLRSGLRHGWSGARELSWLACNRRLRIRTLEVHAIQRYLWVSELLGLDDSAPETTLHLGPEAEARAATLRALPGLAGRPLAVLAPGTMWETKHWRPEGFAEIARRLLAQGVAVAVAGTRREGALVAGIVAAAPGAVDLAGQTTPAEMAALLRGAALCVTNDSGAMHLAAAMGTPVAAIFGPTDPVQVGPWQQGQNVLQAGVPCAPCNLRRLAQCPYSHRCMHQVSADDVWQVATRLLGRPA